MAGWEALSCLCPMASPSFLRRNAPRWGKAFGLVLAAALPGAVLPGSPPSMAATAAEADVAAADPAVQAIVERAQQACRDALARRFSSPASSVEVWITPGLRIAIEAGATGLADLRRNGLEFGWMLPQKPAPAPIGLCRTSGEGRVVAIEQQPD